MKFLHGKMQSSFPVTKDSNATILMQQQRAAALLAEAVEESQAYPPLQQLSGEESASLVPSSFDQNTTCESNFCVDKNVLQQQPYQAKQAGPVTMISHPVRASDAAMLQQIKQEEEGDNVAPVVLKRKEKCIAATVFIIIGVNSLIPWNTLLNMAPYMSKSYFEGKDYGNTFLAVFQSACVIVQMALIWLCKEPRLCMFYIAIVLEVLGFFIFTPLTSELKPGPAVICAHLVCALWGVSSGLLQGAGFSYAGALPVNFAGFISSGQGFAGLLAFALTTFFGFTFFDISTRAGLTAASWTLYSVCALCGVLLVVGLWVLSSCPWARSAYERKNDSEQGIGGRVSVVVGKPGDGETVALQKMNSVSKKPEAVDGSDSPHTLALEIVGPHNVECGASSDSTVVAETRANKILVETTATRDESLMPARPVLGVVRAMAVPLLIIFFTFFFTLNMFPRMGPVSWKYNQDVRNHFLILFGLFAVGDTIGRSAPSLATSGSCLFRWLLLPPKVALIFSFSRVLFYVPFVIAYKMSNVAVMNDFWWLCVLMLLFAFSHGWCSSLGFVHAVSVVREKEKGLTGPISVLTLCGGILCGLYLALAY